MKPLLPRSDQDRRLYVVATVHLDTQWRWTVQDTISKFIPHTLKRNFEIFADHPFFVVSFEGAFRYMLMKEYYPVAYEELKRKVAEGRWRLAGSMLDSPDVNMVSPESLIRHILYGNRFFSREFGQQSEDLFLPDCFGFGAAVPSVASHCRLIGFSAQKFGNWMAPASIPFEIGTWRGPDGEGIIAAIRPEGYGEGLDEDLSQAQRYVERIDRTGEQSGAYVAMKYVGVGDRGGGLDEASVDWLQRSVEGKGPITVELSGSDQLFRDLSIEQIDKLPSYQGEILLPTHGTGCLTSQAVMKRWNRQNELLAEAAEKAATIAHCHGALPYPTERFEEAWVRFLWHQMHDDLTGTSIPAAYEFSFNDELLSLNQFTDLLTESVGAVAAQLDTRCEGEAIVVFNPLSIRRQDLVEVLLDKGAPATSEVSVIASDGSSLPAQITTNHRGERVLVFLAEISALGFAVFDLQLGSAPAKQADHLVVTTSLIENHRYRIHLDDNGDIAGILDKEIDRELLAEPVRLELLSDRSARWPAWEILFDDIQSNPLEVVGGPAEITVVERGPARVAVQIRRKSKRSTFVQTVRLAAGGAGDCLEIHTVVDWQTRNRLLKAAFRLTSANPEATYDLGLGQIRRGNNRREKYEVPAQQWADLTLPDQSFGVSILNDCKYGWDKPDDQTLRLSLLRSPRVIRKFRHQGRQDLGPHRFTLAVSSHGLGWSPSSTCWQAARLNQRLLAFRTRSHPGPLGRELCFMETDTDDAAVRTLKRSESADRIVVRLQELSGTGSKDIELSSSAPIENALRVDGQERPIESAEVSDGSLHVSLKPFSVQAFALEVGHPSHRPSPQSSQVVSIPYDCVATTVQGEASRRGFDGKGHSYPAELFPSTLDLGGVEFELGPGGSQRPNALTCRGQTLALPDHCLERIHFLAASTGQICQTTIAAGDRTLQIELACYSGLLGTWNRSSKFDFDTSEVDPQTGLIDKHRVAWIATHRHGPEGEDEPYVFCYLFELSMEIDPECREVRLPTSSDAHIFASSLSEGRIGQTTRAARFYG